MALGSLTLTGEQIRAARALGRLEQLELARRSGVSLETVKRLERIRGPVDANSRTLNAISAAFRAIGIEFETDDGVGVRMAHELAPARRPRPEGGRRPAEVVGLLHRLIYYSTIDPALTSRLRDTLEHIFRESVRRNESLGVTGALLACDGRFLQVLEGDKFAVLQVYGAISADERHGQLKVLENRPVSARHFPDWSLCCGLFASDDLMLAREPALKEGFNPDRLSPASALGLLTVMRDLQNEPLRSRRSSPAACPLTNDCLDRACVTRQTGCAA